MEGVTAGDQRLATMHRKLRAWANTLAARLNAHVYLCGSSLTNTEARDVDIRVVLTPEQYEARYGRRGWIEHHLIGDPDPPSEGMRRWMADCAKLGDWATKYCGYNIDFQIQHEGEVTHFGYVDKPRLQLDDLDINLATVADLP